MRVVASSIRCGSVWLLGLVGLALVQTGCAHPVWVEPSVVVHARAGGPVHGPMQGPPVVVLPVPVWGSPPMAMPPRGIAPMTVNRPVYFGHPHRHGHRHGDGR